MSPYKDLLPPLWNTLAIATSTLVANWIWGSWFARTGGTGLAALLIYSIFGWPLMLALIYLVLGFVLRLCEGILLLRTATLLGVIGAGFAVFGTPGPWNLLICAALAVPVGLQARRTAQDDADLENL